MVRYIFSLSFLMFLPGGVAGQDVDLGVTGGFSTYYGDLSPADFAVYRANIKPSAGFFARLQYSKSLGARLGLTYGGLSANEKLGGVRFSRGLTFKTHFAEFSSLGEFYLLNQRYYRSKIIFSLYLTGGVAVFHFDPQTNTKQTNVRLKPLHTEGQGLPGYGQPYSLVQMSIPYGFGIRLTQNSRWGIGVELILRRAMTDYLDDVSSQTVMYGDIYQNFGPEAARLSNPEVPPSPEYFDLLYARGDRKPDFYYTLGLSVSYRLVNRGVSKSPLIGVGECPRF